jgi:uncharacterized OB-fold protein
VNKESQQLWSAWESGRLCFQRCDSCGRAQHPPGPVCSHCHARSLTLADVAGDAELVSWSTVHRAPAQAFADQVPYTVVLARLPDGALVEARAADDDVDMWVVGQRVDLTLGTINGRVLPMGHVR